MKKTLLTLTASAVIASSYASTTEASAVSYKVQKGDSLWLIAQKHALTVSELKSLNNLKSNFIYPAQVLTVTTQPAQSSAPKEAVSPAVNKEENTSSTSPATYKVKSGDSLSKIASQHKISLENLMNWNKLTTTLIFPGDEFIVSKPVPVPTEGKVKKPETTDKSSTEPITTYKVKPGDYLGKVARNFNVSVSDLKKWNELSSDLIRIGQELKINSTAVSIEVPKTETAAETLDYNTDILISEGMKYLGLAYVWGGTTPAGFDCSGFIYYLYNKAGKTIPRYSSDGYFNRSYYVNKPVPGDIVFFSGTYRPGISHLGIYLGNNKFLHAESGGVKVSDLANSYWKKHFDSFKRLY